MVCQKAQGDKMADKLDIQLSGNGIGLLMSAVASITGQEATGFLAKALETLHKNSHVPAADMTNEQLRVATYEALVFLVSELQAVVKTKVERM